MTHHRMLVIHITSPRNKYQMVAIILAQGPCHILKQMQMFNLRVAVILLSCVYAIHVTSIHAIHRE